MTTFDVLAPSPLPPPRDPAWRGIDVGVVLIATAFSIVLALLLGAILLPIFVPMHAAFSATDTRFMLVAQTLGFAGGFGFAALWITRLYQVPFWRAIHWTPLHGDQIWRLATLGVVLSLGLQGLEHFLPIPRKLPIDRLFTPQTAWLLAIYGVVVAPFFEEFLFRGLIYPSLRRSFEEGMTTAEARGWEPFVWLGAFAAVAVAGLGMLLRTLRGAPAEPRLRLIVVGALLVAVAARPLLLLLAAGVRAISRHGHSQLPAIMITGVLFGLVHAGQLANAWAPVLLLSLVGIILTAVRAATNSLVASWLVHSIYNGTLFGLLFLGTHGFHNFDKLVP